MARNIAAVVCLVNNHNSMLVTCTGQTNPALQQVHSVYFRQTYEDPGWWSDVVLQSLGSSISSPQPESWSGTNSSNLAPTSGNKYVVCLILKPFHFVWLIQTYNPCWQSDGHPPDSRLPYQLASAPETRSSKKTQRQLVNACQSNSCILPFKLAM